MDGMGGWYPAGLWNTLEVTIAERFKCFIGEKLSNTELEVFCMKHRHFGIN